MSCELKHNISRQKKGGVEKTGLKAVFFEVEMRIKEVGQIDVRRVAVITVALQITIKSYFFFTFDQCLI